MGSNMKRVSIDHNDIISFGPFRLFATERLLLKGDTAICIGSRAFDILIALVDRCGEQVSKEELMAWVWPNTFVEPANLTVHISALRRTLEDGCAGNRYIVNIPGRGYRFVAPVTFHDARSRPVAKSAGHSAIWST